MPLSTCERKVCRVGKECSNVERSHAHGNSHMLLIGTSIPATRVWWTAKSRKEVGLQEGGGAVGKNRQEMHHICTSSSHRAF